MKASFPNSEKEAFSSNFKIEIHSNRTLFTVRLHLNRAIFVLVGNFNTEA